ncbi:unnamed protein product [Owenia fusiformis]|uniref:Cyclic nucleotide-binding domain-containing protein n=1 Tax=Owenia fusiformis TaxID=6347 RepID=A0A8S4NGI0_OWEFU|nr:unnamed protein product [Owenia fusiformis]
MPISPRLGVPKTASRADLQQLVQDDEQNPNTPMIQVTHPNIPQNKEGLSNPVFTFEDAELAKKQETPSKDEENVLTHRRGSYNSLTVPENGPGIKRLSISSNGQAADNDTGGLKPTISIDQLSTPRTPVRSPSVRSNWSELAKLSNRRPSLGSVACSESGSAAGGSYISGVSSSMSDRLRDLFRKFTSRTEKIRERTVQPPTPSLSSLDDDKSVLSGFDNENEAPPQRQHRLNSFIPLASPANTDASDPIKEEKHCGIGRCRIKIPKFLWRCRFPTTIDPQSQLYLFWLFIVTLAFMYNSWVILLRAAFPYQTPATLPYWLTFDYLCDLIYLLDIVLFKPRIKFINQGMLEHNPKETRKHYIKKKDFKLDVASLLPLDFFYFLTGLSNGRATLLRLPRMLKLKSFWEFYERIDQSAKSVHLIRIAKTLTYMIYLIHVETCGYYAVSEYEGINSTQWTYNGEGTSYIRCLYLATKTATSIGNNPLPSNNLEYMFMCLYWLSGVFVFALLIGQIRDIFQAATAVKTNYRKTMDDTMRYMQSLNVPPELQEKVRMWFNYNWEQQKTLNENSLLQALPKKIRADLAINVHFSTLCKVHLFQDCDKNLLYDLVLKLKPQLYLPDDYICRKGEVGTEMYIVMQGQVEVVGGPDGQTVLATLHEGSVFGEISLLALAGGNRRTADVRSKGFSNLFILSKSAFEEAMRDYPEAQKLLKKRAKKLLAQNAAKNKSAEAAKEKTEVVIKGRASTPKLFSAVIKAVRPDSRVHSMMKGRKLLTNQKSLDSTLSNGDLVPNEKDEIRKAMENTDKETGEIVEEGDQQKEFGDSELDELADDILKSTIANKNDLDGDDDNNAFMAEEDDEDVLIDDDDDDGMDDDVPNIDNLGEIALPDTDDTDDSDEDAPPFEDTIIDDAETLLDKVLEDQTLLEATLDDELDDEIVRKDDGAKRDSKDSGVPSSKSRKSLKDGSKESINETVQEAMIEFADVIEPPRASSSHEKPRSGSGNRVSPSTSSDTRQDHIPLENQVTIDVMIHRERTPTPLPPSHRGLDNPAYEGDKKKKSRDEDETIV